MPRRRLVPALLLVATSVIAPLAAQPVDYANPDRWLCRPGRADACAADLTTSVIAASGAITREPAAPASPAAIDCFYVYPTVSTDSTPNSDLAVGDDERNVAAIQFARFRSVCRPYAPMYRQQTLRAMRAMLAGQPGGDMELAYTDVRDAWRHYLTHDNAGRGVVLIGHSQGSAVLMRLLAQEIEGTPAQTRLVSALLGGWSVAVPTGRDVGGDLTRVPVCTTARQVGCVVAWTTFRDTLPPPPITPFGRVTKPNAEAICVNPAALAGNVRSLRSYLTSGPGAGTLSAGAPSQWVVGAPPVTTPFVSLPGLLAAACTHRNGAHYLALTVQADPADPRTDTIGGDVIVNGTTNRFWGLHLLDMQVVLGDLIELVRQQAAAFTH